MTICHGIPWCRNGADAHCPFSIEGWWLFFYPLSYLTLTFQVLTERFTIYIVASDQEIVYDHLPQIFCSSQYMDACNKMLLPYVVGFDAVGRLIIVDLSKLPHLLVVGATNSGKTVGVQVLITSIIYSKRPSRVNLILIDVGAVDLLPFEGVPHLSCSIIRDRDRACQALEKLRTEMERCITIRNSDNESFKKLPRLVLVIDETTGRKGYIDIRPAEEISFVYAGKQCLQCLRAYVYCLIGYRLKMRGQHGTCQLNDIMIKWM